MSTSEDEDSEEEFENLKKNKKKSISSNKMSLLAKKSMDQAEKISKMRQSASKSSTFSQKIKKSNNKSTNKARNYWIEYYDELQRRWICKNYIFLKIFLIILRF